MCAARRAGCPRGKPWSKAVRRRETGDAERRRELARRRARRSIRTGNVDRDRGVEVRHVRVALGLDIGTTAVKAIALDEEGRVVARAGAVHDLRTAHPGWAEGDPEGWWANAVTC